MKLDAKALTQIAALVETGSFAGAAAALGTSQPAISRDIARIEARLGAALFDRATRPVTPTALALDLAEEGAVILFASRQAALKIARARAGTSGVLRIAGPPLTMDHVVTAMCATFHATHPGVEIQTQPAYLREAAGLVMSGKVDLAVCAVEDFAQPGLTFEPCADSRTVIACRLNHPLTRMSDLQLPQLLTYGWVAPPENSPLDQDLLATMARLGASQAAVRFRSATSAGIRAYLEETDCLAILPGAVVAAMARRYHITALPVELHGPTRRIGLLTRDGQPTRIVRRFGDHLTASFALLG